ncbi:unnamed protein product [Phytophthora fragariaefolia]|uniref:Unnamed protein product n=1 Tax=Phytophthora fragariaefolia TaxID=1490495 RepID=A0A9W7CS34_9STRA|nr:unnamed protein product [Phytophthora fragariaefolia]
MGGPGGPPGGSDDSDSEEDPDPQGHGRDQATPPGPRNPLAAADPFAPGGQSWLDLSTSGSRESPPVQIHRLLIQSRHGGERSSTLGYASLGHVGRHRQHDLVRGGCWRAVGALVQAYRDFETSALMSYWESTHSFPIPDSAVRREPWLGVYHKERKNRRSHAGRRWKTILELLIIAVREAWCDLDILLDPFFCTSPSAWRPSRGILEWIRVRPTYPTPTYTARSQRISWKLWMNAMPRIHGVTIIGIRRKTGLDPRDTYGIRAGSGWTWNPLPDLNHIPLRLFSYHSSCTHHALPNPRICNHFADPLPHLSHQDDQLTLVDPSPTTLHGTALHRNGYDLRVLSKLHVAQLRSSDPLHPPTMDPHTPSNVPEIHDKSCHNELSCRFSCQ